MKKQLSTYPLRLPRSLKVAVAEISKADGTSINQFVTTAVAEKVSAMKTAEFFTERSARADIAGARRLLRREGGGSPLNPKTASHKPVNRLQGFDRPQAFPVFQGREALWRFWGLEFPVIRSTTEATEEAP